MSTPHTTGARQAQQPAVDVLPVCPACSALARRTNAHFCATCGRGLQTVDYLPTDTLRASYHHQYYHPPLMPGHAPHRSCVMRPAPRPSSKRRRTPPDNTTRLALVFATYALVPYLGIIMCPGAVVLGGFELMRAWRAPEGRSTRTAARCVVLGLIIFGVQLFLWWVLLQIPQWARR
ncbi:MAG: hypothetical protein ACJ74W_15590 [Pyrinomonadaceae bacterium]